MILYVDIDETICTYYVKNDKHSERDYKEAIPIEENIQKINKLFNEGHTIIYWTARGALTGIDWTEVTKEQLKEWGALHHDVRMNKPYYNLFIDDKAINSDDFFNNVKEKHVNE